MKRYAIYLFTIILMFCFLVQSVGMEEAEGYVQNSVGNNAVIAIYGDTVIFEELDFEKWDYSIYNLTNHQKQPIGSLDKAIVSGGFYAIQDNMCYFYVGELDRETAEEFATLYAIDMKNGKMDMVLQDKNIHPFVPVSIMDNKLYMIKKNINVATKIGKAHLKVLDLESGKESILFSTDLNYNTKIGEPLVDIACDNGNIYIFKDRGTVGKNEHLIAIYNEKGELIDEIDIGFLGEEYFKSMTRFFKVYGDYIVITSAGRETFLLKRDGSNVEVILHELDMFPMVDCGVNDEVLLYRCLGKGANQFFTLNYKEGCLYSSTLELGDNSFVRYLVGNNDIVVVNYEVGTDNLESKRKIVAYDLFKNAQRELIYREDKSIKKNPQTGYGQ